MKPNAFIFGVAGAIFLLVFAVSSSTASEGGFRPIKTGLWEIEWHTNWAMFVVRNDWRPMEDRARISAEALKHPLYQRACVTERKSERPDTVVLKNDGCNLETGTAGDGVIRKDGTCRGRKDGITELHVTITSRSPETAFIEVKAILDPAAGYPVIETYKMRWISADCGDLLPGTIRPTHPPQ